MARASFQPCGLSVNATVFFILVHVFSIFLTAFGAELYVDDSNTSGPWLGTSEWPYRYIQTAIDNAAPTGTVIMVAFGMYNENIVIDHKDVHLVSASAARTTIDGQHAGSVITILDSTCQLDRFTVRNGLATDGGGMYIEYSDVTLYKMVITANATLAGTDGTFYDRDGGASGGGGGIFSNLSNLELTDCTISYNSTGAGGRGYGLGGGGGPSGAGGGIFIVDTGITCYNCSILNNTTGNGGNSGTNGTGERGGYSGAGAGMYAWASLGIIFENCQIANNAAGNGGIGHLVGGGTGPGCGIYIQNYGPCNFAGCSFINNTGGIAGEAANGGSGGSGGGLYYYAFDNATAYLTNCQFLNNHPGDAGDGWEHGGDGGDGGAAVIDGRAVFSNCTISGNRTGQGIYMGTGGSGGGIHFTGVNENDSFGQLTNCLISDNVASGGSGVDIDGRGGGIYSQADDNPDVDLFVDNCTIVDNIASTDGIITGRGGGIYCEETANVKDSILWNNAASLSVSTETAQLDAAARVVYYNCIQGWTGAWGGIGNFGSDPQFGDPANNDFHVKSTFGRWNATSQSWVYDSVFSPCIDSGDAADLAWKQELWPHGKRINLGVYGGTPEASKSPYLVGCIADINRSDCVGMDDLILFVEKWLAVENLRPEDLTFDGKMNLEDFSVIAANWLLCFP